MTFGYPCGRRQLRQAGLGALGAQPGYNIYRSLPALGRFASVVQCAGAQILAPDESPNRRRRQLARFRPEARGPLGATSMARAQRRRPAALSAGKQPSSRLGCHLRPVALWSASPRPAAAPPPATPPRSALRGLARRRRCSPPHWPPPQRRTPSEPTSAPDDRRACPRPWLPTRQPAFRRPIAAARRRPRDAPRTSTPRRPCDSTTTRQQSRPPPPCSRLGQAGSASSNHPQPETSLDGPDLDGTHGRTSADVQLRLDISPSPPPSADVARAEAGRSHDVR